MGAAAFSNIEDKPFDLTPPISFELTVRKFGDRIRINGVVNYTMTLTCVRCLDEFVYPVESDVDIELAPADAVPEGG